jgi:hypothetical protein
MSSIVSEEGHVTDRHKWQNNKSCIGKNHSDYKLRDSIAFRECLCSIWFKTQCLETKQLLEDAVDGINERIKKELFL